MKTASIILGLVALISSVSAVPQGNARQQGGQGKGNTGNNGKNNTAGGKGGANGGAAGGAAGAGAGAAAGAGNAGANNGTTVLTPAGGIGAGAGDPQKSLTLDPKVIATGFANNGQDVPAAGQVASLTSTNNFINFCLTQKTDITNGKQITTGSCNPAPMGTIPSTENMPSSKFTSPKNGDTLKENTAFTISMAIKNLQTGAFVNAQANYFAAPQQLNAQGTIIGHSHVVVEQLTALDQTTPTDPKKFAFFKGLNAAASGGVLTADVTSGLPAGFYKLSSINSAANHQPVLVPIAQHGSLDDAVYFTITASGAPAQAAGNATAGANGGAAIPPAAATPAKGAAVPKGQNGAANNGKNNNNGNGKGRRMFSKSRL